MYPYRLFLSYSSEDRALAEEVERVLTSLGLVVSWDGKLDAGIHFSDEIKASIARSHLFVPLLTESSKLRPWVHQETGYAMGVGVPILPMAFDDPYPGAFLSEVQALKLRLDGVS